MRILIWVLRALLFFVLFAFALNNQHEAVLRGFFGTEWRTPMVVVVLVSFACGAALAVVSLAPRLWRRAAPPRPTASGGETPAPPRPSRVGVASPGDTAQAPFERSPRDGI